MATQNEIDTIRRRIGDSKKVYTDRILGDGESTEYGTKYQNVFDVVVLIDGEVETGFTVTGESGQLFFEDAPEQDSTIDVTYSYAGYNDSELTGLIDTHGLDGATIECLRELVAGSAKLFDYQQGQTKTQRSQVFKHLKELLDTYEKKIGGYGNGNNVLLGDRSHPLYRKKRKNPLHGDITRLDTFEYPNRD